MFCLSFVSATDNITEEIATSEIPIEDVVNVPLDDEISRDSDPSDLKANFTVDVTDGEDSLTVKFNDASTGNPTNWLWDFGDGETGNEQNITHIYNKYGLFNVSLTIFNSTDSNKIIKTNLIQIYKDNPVILNPGFENGDSGWTYSGNNVKPFGTGNIKHSGNYALRIAVDNGYITQDINLDSISEIKFWARSQSGSKTIKIYLDNEEISTKTITNTYSEYSINISDKNKYNGIKTLKILAEKTVFLDDFSVVHNTIAPDFGIDSYNIDGDEITVNFKDKSYGLISNWLWDFGDGNSSTEQNPIHKYSNSGIYTISLTLSNRDYTSKVNYTMIFGEINNVDFTNNVSEGYPNLTVQFTDLSNGVFDSWLWDFGDGNSSTEQNPIHTYTETRNYDVTLTVSNSLDSKIITKSSLIKLFDKLDGNFTTDLDYVYVNSPVDFPYLYYGNPSSFLWNFGDGSLSILEHPVHVYTGAGEYNVSLTIFNSFDNFTFSKKIIVSEILKADFNLTIRYTDGHASVLISDNSQGNIINWLWDLGDGTTSTTQNPIPEYTSKGYDIGNYNITLTVFNDFDSNTITKSFDVNYMHSNNKLLFKDSFENSTDNWKLYDIASINEEYSHDGDYSIKIRNGLAYNDLNTIMEKEINFDDIDSILVYARTASSSSGSGSGSKIFVYVDGIRLGDEKNCLEITHFADWYGKSFDTTSISGIHTITLMGNIYLGNVWIDDIQYKTSKNIANFSIASSKIEGENISVHFLDTSYGYITSYLWEFDDGLTSNLRNPTHTFTPDTHSVTLHIYRDGVEMDRYSYQFALSLPIINDKTYSSIQNAINNATEYDIINIQPIESGVYRENLLINKSLTLNFNGAVLSAKDNNIPLFNVTNGATVTITNIGLNKVGAFVTCKDSKLIIKDSQINYNLALNEGNIELVNDQFNNAYLTLVANTTIANSTITKGEVIVNNGKSKIFNTTLSGCDVAITQNGGELDIISNLITNNKVGINVTGGKTNLEFNVIINNADYGLVFTENVTNANNWWGSTMPDSYINRTSAGDKYDSYLILNLNTASSVMGVGKEYVVDVYFTDDSDAIVDGYLKTFTLTFTSSDMEILNDNVVIENGKGQINIKTLKETENIKLNTLNEDYELTTPVNSTANVFIEVIGEAIVDNSVVINVEVPLATGNVIFYVDGDVKVVALNNSKANYTISKLTAGNHSIVVFYEGDEVFNPNRNSTTINVPVKEIITSNIKITRVDGNLTVYGILTDSKNNVIDNAIINYNINNGITQNTTTGNDGSFKITGKNGATIFVSFEGNESIIGFNDSITLSDIASNQQDNKTISELQTQLNKTQEMVSNLTDKISDSNKKISNLTSQLDEAQKAIQNLSGNVISTTISANNLAIKALDNGNIQVTLKDANNNLLTNKSVQVIINGVTYNETTNNNGVASISVKYASAGTYNAVVSFIGDDTYKGSIGTSKVVVSKKATTLTAKKATLKVKKAKKIKVTLKSDGKLVAGKTITIKVNKKTFKAKTNSKGVATIKVKVAKKGKFKAVVKFAGDSTYNAVTKKIKLTVKK